MYIMALDLESPIQGGIRWVGHYHITTILE